MSLGGITGFAITLGKAGLGGMWGAAGLGGREGGGGEVLLEVGVEVEGVED